ncbi:hypothetical protein Skr01_30470 [Sphaerisporangium krabiense]|nr:hypothetical protein Skr01_30470 [Sphaerisporangium krabiense]
MQVDPLEKGGRAHGNPFPPDLGEPAHDKRGCGEYREKLDWPRGSQSDTELEWSGLRTKHVREHVLLGSPDVIPIPPPIGRETVHSWPNLSQARPTPLAYNAHTVLIMNNGAKHQRYFL